MAHVPSPEGSFALPPAAGARDRLRRVAAVLAHVCGLTLHMKRYIEKSRAKEWALFYLSINHHSANELLFGISNYSKYSLSKDFEKLKTLLFIQPNQRSQENLREIQLYLKKNRAFHSLPKEVQLQLCQTAIYQEFEAGSMLLRQGHVPLECYLILAGHLKVMSSNTSMNRNTNSEILSEFEEGDFIGETCLLTNANRPASFFCKTDVKVLVISKEDFYCILAQRVQEQYQETCSFLGSLPLFFSWPKGKIDFLVHCSLRRYYRAGTTIISDNLNSHFLVFIISGRCRIIAQMSYEDISVHSCVMKTGSSTWKNVHTLLPPKGTPAVTGRILETSTVSPKTSFSAARKKTLDTKKPPLQGSSPATCFVEIRMLEQGDVFGLAEALDNSCDLHVYLVRARPFSRMVPESFLAKSYALSIRWGAHRQNSFQQRSTRWKSREDHVLMRIKKLQVSEGVECIFIPKSLFLAEASPEFRRAAVGLVCAYPTEEDIGEYLVERQAWNEYKARLLAQQLKTGS